MFNFRQRFKSWLVGLIDASVNERLVFHMEVMKTATELALVATKRELEKRCDDIIDEGYDDSDVEHRLDEMQSRLETAEEDIERLDGSDKDLVEGEFTELRDKINDLVEEFNEHTHHLAGMQETGEPVKQLTDV